MEFKELTYKNNKLRLKNGRVQKRYSLDKISCLSEGDAHEEIESFILPFEIAWQIQDGVIALNNKYIIYKCSPKKVKQFILDSSIPPSEFSVIDFDKTLEVVKDKEFTSLLNDNNNYFTRYKKWVQFKQEELKLKYYEYWTNDCILILGNNQNVYMLDIMNGFNSLYPNSQQRKEVFGRLSNVTNPKIPYITTNVFSGLSDINFNDDISFYAFKLCTGKAFAGIDYNRQEPIKSILNTLSERVYKLFTAPANLDLYWANNLSYCGGDRYNYRLENVQVYHKIFLELTKEHKNINSVEEARDWYAQYLSSPYSSKELNLYTLKHTNQSPSLDCDVYDYLFASDKKNNKLLICSFGLLMRDLLSRQNK